MNARELPSRKNERLGTVSRLGNDKAKCSILGYTPRPPREEDRFGEAYVYGTL